MNEHSNEKFYRGMSGTMGSLGKRDRDKFGDEYGLLGI